MDISHVQIIREKGMEFILDLAVQVLCYVNNLNV